MTSPRRPSPTQGVWALGPLPIRAYALCIVAGIVAAVLITERRWVARGGAPGDVLDIAVWAVPFGIIGGRMYHVISSPVPTSARAGIRCGPSPSGRAAWASGAPSPSAVSAPGSPVDAGASAACVRGRAGARAAGRAGDRAAGQLVQQRAVRQCHRPSVGAEDLRVGQRPGGARGRRRAGAAGHVPPDVPLRDALEPGRGALVVWADRRFPSSATAGPSRCMSRPARGQLWIELLHRPAETFFGVRLNVFTSIIVGLLAVAYLFCWRGRPRVITRGADHAGRDAAAVPAGPAEEPRPEAPVTMVTGDPPPTGAFAQAGFGREPT